MHFYVTPGLLLLPVLIGLFVLAMIYRFFYYHFFGGKQREQRQEEARLAEIDELLKKSREERRD